jgi:HEAT repeat protein
MKSLSGLMAVFLCVASAARAADVDELIKQLKDKDTDTRRAAAKALGDSGTNAKPAVNALAAALKDSDLFVRRFSAQALGEIGPDAKDAAPGLGAILKDGKEKKEVQEAAATALGKIGKAGVSALSGGVKNVDLDPLARKAAIASLGEIGPDAKDGLAALIESLQLKPDKNRKGPPPPDVRVEAVTALGKIATAEDKEVIEALETLVNDKGARGNVKKLATDALKAIKERK